MRRSVEVFYGLNSDIVGPVMAPFVGLTVLCWGMYGICLHTGQLQMGDPEFGRYKAFLFVGIAYLLTAVLAPAGLLAVRGAEWSFTTGGIGWSLLAGVVGAVGAFSVLLAFGNKGSPAVVMSLFPNASNTLNAPTAPTTPASSVAGAPIVNGVVTVAMHNLWAYVRWPFVAGIAMAAVGAYLVVSYSIVTSAQSWLRRSACRDTGADPKSGRDELASVVRFGHPKGVCVSGG